MKKTSLIFTCLILASCVTKKEIITQKETKDSVVYVDKIRIDTIRETKTVDSGFDNEIIFRCDSATVNQSYKSGGVKYKFIKEKGEVRFVIKKDSSICVDKYQSILKVKDSLQRVVDISVEDIKTVRQPFFADFWKIAFFVILVFWALGLTPKFLISKVKMFM